MMLSVALNFDKFDWLISSLPGGPGKKLLDAIFSEILPCLFGILSVKVFRIFSRGARRTSSFLCETAHGPKRFTRLIDQRDNQS